MSKVYICLIWILLYNGLEGVAKAQDCSASNSGNGWDYYSADSYTGDFEDASTWCGGRVPGDNGDLTGTDNGLIIENSNASPSSLIIYGTASPLVTFKWSLDELRYWYIGHSVASVSLDVYNNSFVSPNDYLLYEWTTK